MVKDEEGSEVSCIIQRWNFGFKKNVYLKMKGNRMLFFFLSERKKITDEKLFIFTEP